VRFRCFVEGDAGITRDGLTGAADPHAERRLLALMPISSRSLVRVAVLVAATWRPRLANCRWVARLDALCRRGGVLVGIKVLLVQAARPEGGRAELM
jgi:hypothetical protein